MKLRALLIAPLVLAAAGRPDAPRSLTGSWEWTTDGAHVGTGTLTFTAVKTWYAGSGTMRTDSVPVPLRVDTAWIHGDSVRMTVYNAGRPATVAGIFTSDSLMRGNYFAGAEVGGTFTMRRTHR